MKMLSTLLAIILLTGTAVSQEKITITKSSSEQKGTAEIIHEDCNIQPVELPSINVIPKNITPYFHNNKRTYYKQSNDTAIGKVNIDRVLKPGEYVYFEIDTKQETIFAVNSAVELSDEAKQAIGESPEWLREQLSLKFAELRNHSVQTEKQYAGLIINSENRFKDEVAFVIANSSYQTLIDSRFSQDKQAIVRNAEMIYRYADSLKYVELVEYGDFPNGDYGTTTKYRIYDQSKNDTVWSEIPPDIYYWYIVHPKMDQEGVYVKDNGSDASGQRTYDYAWRQFIWANPDPNHDYRNVNKTTSKGSVTTIPRFGELIKQATILWDRKKTYYPFNRPFAGSVSALDIIGNWCSRALPVDVTLPRAFQPNQILMKHDGMCNEDAFLVASTCRTALIPIIYLGTWCEDHVFGAVWDEDWNHFEFFRGGLSESGNDFYGITNMLDGGSYGWKTSMVEGFRPDGYALNFTKYYTNTANFDLRVMDKNGYPIPGALVNFFASPNAYNANYLKCGTAYTDFNGYANVPIGEGKKYLAQVYHPKYGWSPADSTQAYIATQINTQAGFTYRVNVAYPTLVIEDIPAKVTTMPGPEDYAANLIFYVRDILTGQNQRDSQKSRFYLWNEEKKGNISVLVCDELNFNKFRNNEPFEAMDYIKDINGMNSTILLKDGEKTFIILSNHGPSSYYQSIKAECELIGDYHSSAEEFEDSEVTITPNPARDYIEINLNNVIPAQAGIHDFHVRVYDVLGQIQSTSVNFVDTSAGGGQVRINVSQLSPGVYFVQVGGKVLKFVKM